MSYPLDINDMAYECHETACNHGFWNYSHGDITTIQIAKLGLITSEVGEAIEAVRQDDSDNLMEELADIIIRTLDFAGWLSRRDHSLRGIQQAILTKMTTNRERLYMHGKRA